MTSRHSVRRASLHDLDRLTDLFEQYRAFYKVPADAPGARLFLYQRMERDESVIYVCEEGAGDLVGFVQLFPLFSSTRLKRYWLLNDLYVQPESRGEGASLLLLDAAKTLCRVTAACGMYLETAKSNSVGNTLYPRAGFRLDAENNFYLWDTD